METCRVWRSLNLLLHLGFLVWFFFFSFLSETPQTSISLICYTDNELISIFAVIVLTAELISNKQFLCVPAACYFWLVDFCVYVCVCVITDTLSGCAAIL